MKENSTSRRKKTESYNIIVDKNSLVIILFFVLFYA